MLRTVVENFVETFVAFAPLRQKFPTKFATDLAKALKNLNTKERQHDRN